MRCPKCTTDLCAECGTELKLGVRVPESLVCEDHRDLCSVCAHYVVEDEDCMDCVLLRKEKTE